MVSTVPTLEYFHFCIKSKCRQPRESSLTKNLEIPTKKSTDLTNNI